MEKGIYIANAGGAASFKKEFVPFASSGDFVTTYTVTAQFHSGSTEAKTSLVGKTIYGAAVTALAAASGVDNKAELCTVQTAQDTSAGDRTAITTVSQDYLKLVINADLTIGVTHWTTANASGVEATASKIRVQAVYTDATGVDTADDHVNDKIGVAGNVSLTVA